MSFNRLEGSIDIKGLNDLRNLRYLKLSGNKIESFQLSGGGGRLSFLEKIYLDDNLFNNSIFASINELSNLGVLSLVSNKLKGSIDINKDLSGLANLEEIDFSYNPEIDGFVGHQENRSLIKLEIVGLNGVFTNGSSTQVVELVKAFSSANIFFLEENRLNRATAIQDHEMYAFTNVTYIFLDHSYLNTDILQSLGVFPSLRYLSLSNCWMNGSIPNQGWHGLRNLDRLYMNENALEGMLPSCLGNLKSLKTLDISDNQFTGNLTVLANLSSLEVLLLSKNNLQISFSVLQNLANLKMLFIDQNKLVMEPPHASLPIFQLEFLNVSSCKADQQLLMKEPLWFLDHQHELRYVDLSYNNFNGSIPNWLFENNPNLEAILLTGNSFTGPLLLPSSPNVNLHTFDMSKNNLQGQIPTNICSAFPYLNILILSQNDLEGNIPSCLGDIGGLEFLDLSDNRLFGGISYLTMSGSLKILKLSNNNLIGKIKSNIFASNSNLKSLYLDGNNFVGEILDVDISTIGLSLLAIDLSRNNLTGKIPRWIWSFSSLKVLALSNNHFEGSIPIELCNLDELRTLDFSHNSLTGSIPSCFNPRHIVHVHLNGNKLSSSLIEALPNSSSLVTLDLGGNNLTGSIPEWISKLLSLSTLILKANHLDGGIPTQLCKLDLLTILDLSENMLSGPIPSCLGDLPLATSFDKSVIVSYNYTVIDRHMHDFFQKIFPQQSNNANVHPAILVEESVEFTTKSGSLLYKGDILNYMSGIDLSCNKLTGHIPFELGKLSGIHALNLSHNNLFGIIPSSFSKLKQIESLDLSYNHLSGKIPSQLLELISLEVFSVAHNNLSGSTPDRKAQFGTFDESSYEGNPLLCGLPLHNNCSNATVSIESDSHDYEDSFLDTYVFCVTFLVCYLVELLVIFVVLYINPFWRRRWFFFIENFIDNCRYSAGVIFLRCISSE